MSPPLSWTLGQGHAFRIIPLTTKYVRVHSFGHVCMLIILFSHEHFCQSFIVKCLEAYTFYTMYMYYQDSLKDLVYTCIWHISWTKNLFHHTSTMFKFLEAYIIRMLRKILCIFVMLVYVGQKIYSVIPHHVCGPEVKFMDSYEVHGANSDSCD